MADVTITMRDNFDDNSIDTAKWDETDPSGVIAETSQVIQLNMSHASNWTFGDNRLVSDSAISSGVAVAQAYVDWNDPGANEAFGGFGLYVDANNFAFMGSRTAPGSKMTLYVKCAGITDYLDQTGLVDKAKDFKVTYDLTSHEIKFWYWNSTAWVQVGTTQVSNIGSSVKFAIFGEDNTAYARADVVSIDNAYFVQNDYSINPPIFTRSLTETLTLTDANVLRVITRTFAEVLSLVDTMYVLTGRLFSVTLTETLTLSDNMIRTINGFAVSSWTRVTKAASITWTRASKAASITWNRIGKP